MPLKFPVHVLMSTGARCRDGRPRIAESFATGRRPGLLKESLLPAFDTVGPRSGHRAPASLLTAETGFWIPRGNAGLRPRLPLTADSSPTGRDDLQRE